MDTTAHLKDSTGFIIERHPIRLYFLSIVVGVISSFAAIGFIYAYDLLRAWIYFSPTPSFVYIAHNIPSWAFFISFCGGGLIIGLFIYYIVPLHGHGHGMPHLLYSYRHFEIVGARQGISSMAASVLTIGLGASVGREGPIMYFAGSITGWVCHWFRLKGHYFRVLLCSAIGASLATSLHSTFAAIFFVLEVISFSLTTIDLLPITLAVFAGAIVREIFPHILPPTFYSFKALGNIHELISFVILGILCGILAILFINTLKRTIQAHTNNQLPKWIWPPIGGIGLALIAIYVPQAMGLSFDALGDVMAHSLPLQLLFALLIAKLISTYLSIGFGFSGGIITPALAIGIFFGYFFGSLLLIIYPDSGIDANIYGLGGGAAFISVVIGAPLTATILAYEYTHNISLTINVFVAIFCAQLVMRSFKTESFFKTIYVHLFRK